MLILKRNNFANKTMSFSTLEVVRRLELPYGLEVMLIWGELVAPGGIRGDGISGGKR